MDTPPRKLSRRSKVIAANSALLLTSLVLAAGTAEVGVRIAAPQQLIELRPDLWQPADTVGWMRRSNIDVRINTGEREVRLRTDADGFRVGERGRTDGAPVLLIGDSFMEALQVDHEQSLAGLLERSLTASMGAPISVRNAGVSDWSPGQYLSRARALLPQDDYRLLITTVYVGNDAKPLRLDYVPPRPPTKRYSFRFPRALSRAELMDATLHPLNVSLETRSHLFVMLRKRMETFRMKTGLSALYLPQEFLKVQATSERWTVTADVCRDIHELARAHGMRAVFVLIPTDFQVDAAKFDSYVRGFGVDPQTVDIEQPTTRLREEMTNRGLLVIDALPRFRELHQGGQKLYGSVDHHLSPEGHQALADLVTPVATTLMSDE